MQRADQPVWKLRTRVSAVLLGLACATSARHGYAQPPAAKQVQATPGDATADRHKALQADAAHLLQLATKLKDNVDRSRKDELSLQVIREADEIEKLAKALKSRLH